MTDLELKLIVAYRLLAKRTMEAFNQGVRADLACSRAKQLQSEVDRLKFVVSYLESSA